MADRGHPLLAELGIFASGPVAQEHEDAMTESGYNLEQLSCTEGLNAERFHDALFLSEDIARAVVGSNYPRIVASMRRCTRAVSGANRVIIDLGGGCGVTCFDAARLNPHSRFVVVDRSRNALAVGSKWASQLGLSNVTFERSDFTDTSGTTSLVGNSNDVVLLEYVFDPGGELEDEEKVIEDEIPAFRTAAALVRSGGRVQVGFGDFREEQFSGMIRAAYRCSLSFSSVDVATDGFAVTFEKERPDERRSEEADVFAAFDDFACQCRTVFGP